MHRNMIGKPIIEAHRGDSANAPENTIAAFRQAVELGIHSIELDVHPTKDGELVVMHDDNVTRTTDGQGEIADLTLAEIRRLDAGSWFAATFAGEAVPTLAEVFELLNGTSTRLNIEIKASPASELVAMKLKSLLHRASEGHLVSSFDLGALLAVREMTPNVTLAMLGSGQECLDLARENGFSWMNVHYKSVTNDLVAQAHASGIRVMIWTLDDAALFEQYQQWGVDKICTNRPGMMLAEAEKLA